VLKRFSTLFVYALVGMVAFAAAIRLTWELLRPALVPVSIIALVVFVAAVVARLIWQRGAL